MQISLSSKSAYFLPLIKPEIVSLPAKRCKLPARVEGATVSRIDLTITPMGIF